MNKYLKEGQYFFSDIRKEGVVLYELDDEPLTEPVALTPVERLRVAAQYFEQRQAEANAFLETARFQISQFPRSGNTWRNLSAFSLHQALEQAYSCVLLTLTNYAPSSHNIKFLRSLAEEQDRQLAEAFPRDQHRERAWFNTLNEAYVKARYSKHFEISAEALDWLIERAALLISLVVKVCRDHLETLARRVA